MLQLLDKNNNNSSTDEEEVVVGGVEGAATTSGLHLKQATTRSRINITGGGDGGGCTRTWSTKARKIYHLTLLLMIFLGGSSGKLYFMFTDFVNFNYNLNKIMLLRILYIECYYTEYRPLSIWRKLE